MVNEYSGSPAICATVEVPKNQINGTMSATSELLMVSEAIAVARAKAIAVRLVQQEIAATKANGLRLRAPANGAVWIDSARISSLLCRPYCVGEIASGKSAGAIQ